MKTHFVLSATAASLLASCATDPALAEKKKSVSIGRFGVTQTTPVDAQAPVAPAPTPAPAPAPAVVENTALSQEAAPAPSPEPQRKYLFDKFKKSEQATVSAPSAPVSTPAPVQEAAPAPAPAPEKKPLFSWNPKKKEKADVTAAAPPAPTQQAAPSPAPAPAQQRKYLFDKFKKSEQATVSAPSAPAPVQEAAPAPEKKSWFANWGKKKEEQAAPAPQNPQTASAPAVPKRKASIGQFGITYSDATEQVAAAPASEKKSKFSWFKGKNQTDGAPVAVQVQDKPVAPEKKEKQQAPKQKIAKSDPPVEFKERGRSAPLSGDIRLPDMSSLPEGNELKSSGSTTKKTGKEGAVISRPPVEEKKE